MNPIHIKISRLLFLLAAVHILWSCQEEEKLTYYDPNAPAPEALNSSTLSITNSPGKATIHYKVPQDDKLLYVKAVYESAPGIIREAKASIYTDTLFLEGFHAAGDYPVKLYAVGKNEKESQPVEVVVSPMTPPVLEAFPSLSVSAVFGGVRGGYSNEHQGELKAVLLADTAGRGEYTQLRSYVSNMANATFVYSGLESKSMDFAVYLQDRYGNRSDTVRFDNLTPMFEERIDDDTWEFYRDLPSDLKIWTSMGAGNHYAPWTMWDGDLAASWGGVYVMDISGNNYPYTITIKLGREVRLSRLVVHHWRLNGGGYAGNAPRFFQIYGSNKDKPGDDLFGEDWTLLGDFESKIPSGQPQPTQADRDFAVFDGEPFFLEVTDDIPEPFVPTKFLRIRFMGNWAGNGIGEQARQSLAELKLFGQYVD